MIYKIFLAALYIASICSAQAANIKANIKAERLAWISARNDSSHLTPSQWGLAPTIPVADGLVALNPQLANPIQNIQLIGSKGGSVSVSMQVIGVEYVLSQTPTTPLPENNRSGVLSGNILSLINGNESGKYVFNNERAPFTHIRPIFDSIDSNQWVNLFKSADLEKDIYTATVTSIIPYDYYRNGVRIRNTISISNIIEVDYNPAVIYSVTGGGIKSITPRYYGFPTRMVAGEVLYQVTASGHFESGLTFGLKRTDNFYTLVYSENLPSGEIPEIPYTVTCQSGCDLSNGTLIDNGTPNIDEHSKVNVIGIDGSKRTANLSLMVSFNDKKMSELKTGLYQGSFTLIFQAEM